MKKLLCTAVALFVLAAGLSAEMGKGKMGMKGMNCASMCDSKVDYEAKNIDTYLQIKLYLKLTDDQVSRIETIKAEFEKEQIKRQADIDVARIDLKTAMKKDQPDFAGAKEKQKVISNLQLVSKLAALDAYEKAFNVLTADQKAEVPDGLKSMKMNKKAEMKDHKMHDMK